VNRKGRDQQRNRRCGQNKRVFHCRASSLTAAPQPAILLVSPLTLAIEAARLKMLRSLVMPRVKHAFKDYVNLFFPSSAQHCALRVYNPE
jgi:hypothetical protein